MPAQSIAIDARVLTGQWAGKGRYLLGVLEGWREIAPADQLIIYGDREGASQPFHWPEHWQWVPAAASLAGAVWLGRDARRRRAAALFSPSAYSVTVFSPLPTVMVVHDLAIFRVPESRPALRVWLPERLFLTRALHRAARIVAVSAFTKAELVDYFHISPERILVAPNAVSSSFHPAAGHDQARLADIRRRYQLPEQFLLCVGTIEPRKNPYRLIEAFRRLPLTLQHTFPLVWAGKIGWSVNALGPILRRLQQAGVFYQLDYVPDEDLPRLYNLATALIYPSLYEGFGLPPLEAMAAGTAVITSSTSSLPEVVGKAALLVNPLSIPSIVEGIRTVLDNHQLRQTLAARGPKQAAGYRWTKTAEIIRRSLNV